MPTTDDNAPDSSNQCSAAGQLMPESTPKHRRLSLRKNFSWVFVGTLFYNLTSWLMLMVLAKLGKPTDVGLLVLGRAICMPVMWLSSLNLASVMVTDTKNEFRYGQYLGLRIITAFTAFFIVLGISMLPRYDWSTKWVIILLGFGITVFSIRDIFLAVVVKNECMNISARSKIILAFVSLGGFVTAMYLTRSLIVSLGVLLISRLGVTLFHDLPAARSVARTFHKDAFQASLKPNWSLRKLLPLCLAALPLGASLTLSSLNTNIPIYFLDAYHGKAATGYFGAMSSVVLALSVVIGSLAIAATPRLAKYFVENRTAFLKLVIRLVLIGAAGGGGGMVVAALFGRQILTLAFTAEYAAYAQDFFWIFTYGGFYFVMCFLTGAITATRAFSYLLGSYAIVTLGTVGLSAWWIPDGGVTGAVWCRLAGSVFAVVVLGVTLAVIVKRRPCTHVKKDDGLVECTGNNGK